MNFFVLISGIFCQLPRFYLAAIHSKYLKGWRNLATLSMVPFLILEFINFANWKQNSYYFVNSLKLS